MQAQLEQIVKQFKADTGTVHLIENGVLILKAHQGIPPPVVKLVGEVPVGKGMAGLAAQKNEPISSCNIQSDNTGNVRPGALQTGVNGAIVVPIRDSKGQVRGALGIAVHREYTYSEAETHQLLAEAAKLAP
jgi:L-methionine (R)-S-oxide reductase